MRLSEIPYQSFFRRVDEGALSYGPVYLKPNVLQTDKTHIPVKDEKGNELFLPKGTEVEILDKMSNFA